MTSERLREEDERGNVNNDLVTKLALPSSTVCSGCPGGSAEGQGVEELGNNSVTKSVLNCFEELVFLSSGGDGEVLRRE